MNDLQGIVKIGIYALMGVSVLWAAAAVTMKSLFHSALAFVAVLLGIAGIYIALHAEFLAIVQVLVYVGAVMTLVIFAIMLTERLTDKTVVQNNKQSLISAFGAIAFLTILVKVIVNTPWPIRSVGQNVVDADNTKSIGEALLGHYVFPFEVLAVFLTAVVIGAVVIAKKEKAS